MDPKVMVVWIVAIVMIASIFKARYRQHHHRGPPSIPVESPETDRLREEVKVLKERVAVLERIATDKHNLLEQEFERLKDSR